MPNSSPASDTNLAAEVQALREALSQTQKQVAAQQAEIQTLKAQSKAAPVTPATDNQVPVETEPRTYDLASPDLAQRAHMTRQTPATVRAARSTNRQSREIAHGLFQV